MMKQILLLCPISQKCEEKNINHEMYTMDATPLYVE